MKIILANYRYFLSGGPERYMFNVTEALEAQGHEIIPFSIRYDGNRPTEYSGYFTSPIGQRNEVYFDQQSFNHQTIIKSLSRLFYSKEVENGIDRLLNDTKPDVAYLLHYLRKLSPAVLVGIHKHNIPIVVRLSDFAMVCPQLHLFRERKACELCIERGLWSSVRHQCVKASYGMSVLNYLATTYHKRKAYFDLVDRFICTNEFMYDVMRKAGYSADRLSVVPTLTALNVFKPSESVYDENLIIYSGRINYLKGVHLLIEAMHLVVKQFACDLKLKIFGRGDETYIQRCQSDVRRLDLIDSIEFCGEVESNELSEVLSSALVSVVPSVWYENLPNSAIESLACGTPVIASNHGSLREVVVDGSTGYLFNPGDIDDLARKILLCYKNKNRVVEMSENARVFAQQNYSDDSHVQSLIDIFHEVVS